MPFGYEETRLWRSSLGERGDDAYGDARTRLRTAYHRFRERAALLAAEIPQDLRDYTVHDATHLDALWELADLIAGPAAELTPTEAYVLGGAFLIHDLGMGLAAWPGGMAELAQQPDWKDILAACASDLLGHSAPPDELEHPSLEIVKAAKEVALREKHASHAADLALVSWTATGTGTTYHLIDDVDLRTNYGRLIGQIAASHWWDIDKVTAAFPATTIGAPVDCPDDWTVDPLKLACLLRLADAAHLDARRAPGFLRAVRRPGGVSDTHWAFQGHLQRPRLEGDRLLFTAARPFDVTEAAAWWLCYDTLQSVDRELHDVDSLLTDRARARMAARSVKGADSPFRLSNMIPTSGWMPVDARVTVGNVPALVRKLGGESLYGDQPEIALRELIQNAADAIRALAALTGSAPQTVRVALRQEGNDWWLSVSDSGIGMSQQVMVGPLLDFGRSYWGSQLMRHESPGLASSSFRPVGRFGIGFYAVFMLGDCVRVVSRRFDEASADTRVLEFEVGLAGRPILRPAKPSEIRHMGGTTVTVRLRKDPFEEDGLLGPERGQYGPFSTRTLSALCETLAPALAVDLVAVEPDGVENVCIRADDWKSIPGEQLVVRLSGDGSNVFPNTLASLEDAGAALRPIFRDGEIVGRAALAPSPPAVQSPNGDVLRVWGVVAAGGLHVTSVGGGLGIFTGAPLKADRTSARLDATDPEIAAWASEQAAIWEKMINTHRGEWDICVSLLARLGANTHGIQLCCARDGYMNADEVSEWARSRPDILAVDDLGIDVVQGDEGLVFWDSRGHRRLDLYDNVIVIRSAGRYSDWDIWGDEFPDKRWELRHNSSPESISPAEYWWYLNQRELTGLIFKCVTEGWDCDLELALSGLSNFGRRFNPVSRVSVGRLKNDQAELDMYPVWRAQRPDR